MVKRLCLGNGQIRGDMAYSSIIGREKGSEGTLFHFSDHKGNSGRFILQACKIQ